MNECVTAIKRRKRQIQSWVFCWTSERGDIPDAVEDSAKKDRQRHNFQRTSTSGVILCFGSLSCAGAFLWLVNINRKIDDCWDENLPKLVQRKVKDCAPSARNPVSNLACHPFTHNTCFNVWATSTKSLCAAITSSISLYAIGVSSMTSASLRHSTPCVAFTWSSIVNIFLALVRDMLLPAPWLQLRRI